MTSPSIPVLPAEVAELTSRIISVRELLLDSSLTVPQYQRPYKWTGRNINQLFSDVATHKDKSSYRLGTIVFHEHEGTKDIVDGQQRTISLALAIRALIKRRKEKELDRKDLREQLGELERRMVNPAFESEISKINIHNNYLEVSRIEAARISPRSTSTSFKQVPGRQCRFERCLR